MIQRGSRFRSYVGVSARDLRGTLKVAMTDGYVLLVTDRIDRGEAVVQALGDLLDLKVTGPDFAGHEASHFKNGRIEGVITDISFSRNSSASKLNELLRASNIKSAPLMCLLRQNSEDNFLKAKSMGAKVCIAGTTPSRALAAAVINTTHPNESIVDGLVNRGLAKSGSSLEALFETAAEGGLINSRAVDEGVDPVINAIQAGGIARWLDSVWVHDDTTYQHCLQVAGLAAAVALRLNFSKPDQQRFTRAALMHDLGKGRIPLAILNKPGALDDDERAIMRTHSLIGHQILVEGGVTDELTLDAALHHHEMLDGTGYPDKLSGEGISDPVRLMTVCDIYAALVEKRPYKEAKSPKECFQILHGMGSKIEQSMVNALSVTIGH